MAGGMGGLRGLVGGVRVSGGVNSLPDLPPAPVTLCDVRGGCRGGREVATERWKADFGGPGGGEGGGPVPPSRGVRAGGTKEGGEGRREGRTPFPRVASLGAFLSRWVVGRGRAELGKGSRGSGETSRGAWCDGLGKGGGSSPAGVRAGRAGEIGLGKRLGKLPQGLAGSPAVSPARTVVSGWVPAPLYRRYRPAQAPLPHPHRGSGGCLPVWRVPAVSAWGSGVVAGWWCPLYRCSGGGESGGALAGAAQAVGE